MLDQNERQRIVDALALWARSAPDEPVFGLFGDGELMRPEEVLNAVESETAAGKAILEILEHGVRREGLDKAVSRLLRSASAHVRDAALSEHEYRLVMDALRRWAPSVPDEPAIGLLGRTELMRPRDVVYAIEHQSEAGKAILRILGHSVRREGVDTAIARLLHSPSLRLG
jgi:hypothetical protein